MALAAVVSEVEMIENVEFKAAFKVPRPTMMPTPTTAAIRPYSIAVAPDSSFMKRENMVIVVLSQSYTEVIFRSGSSGEHLRTAELP